MPQRSHGPAVPIPPKDPFLPFSKREIWIISTAVLLVLSGFGTIYASLSSGGWLAGVAKSTDLSDLVSKVESIDRRLIATTERMGGLAAKIEASVDKVGDKIELIREGVQQNREDVLILREQVRFIVPPPYASHSAPPAAPPAAKPKPKPKPRKDPQPQRDPGPGEAKKGEGGLLGKLFQN